MLLVPTLRVGTSRMARPSAQHRPGRTAARSRAMRTRPRWTHAATTARLQSGC